MAIIPLVVSANYALIHVLRVTPCRLPALHALGCFISTSLPVLLPVQLLLDTF